MPQPLTVAILLIAVSPWIAVPLVTLWRARGARSLDDVSDAPSAAPPLVSVIVPARDERRNIERCMRSILASRYPALELVVVDDHSTDGTRDLARAIAADDRRACVIANADLPRDWMGKQWACATGARAARGELLLFLDADTAIAPDLVPRMVNARARWAADLLSVAGWQELGSFWERLVQPQIFSTLFARYGGTEGANRSTRARDKIANGQCLLVTRAAYDAVGGHAAVRAQVAEDLMLAQTVFRAGKKVVLALALHQLSTRMYTSLREIVEGWSKNVFAGGLESMPIRGVLGRVIFPVMLLLAPLAMLAPPLVLAVSLLGSLSGAVLLWSLVTTVASLLWWLAVYRWLGEPLWYALLYPLGALVFLAIVLRAIARGRRVRWKGREYGASGG